VEDLRSLLDRTRGGDLDAFAEIVRRFQDMAQGYAYSILGDADEAQDAAQEAFITAYLKLAEVREPERFAGWLRRVVFSACRAVIRKRTPTVPMAQADGVPSAAADPARSFERAELQETVRAAIRSLSPPNRSATALFYIDGYTIEEVAGFLQVPTGTVKRRLHDSRQQLKERMMEMVHDHMKARRLPAEFAQQVLKRISHWERFDGTPEEKVSLVESDPEWVRLIQLEIELEPMSPECRDIRRQIACQEACHEHYLENVEAIVAMIGAMKPGRIIDCGEACDTRRARAAAYSRALQVWRDNEALPADADESVRDVFGLLGERTPEKLALVEHLIGKLDDNAYAVYANEDEDFASTESRIQHLEICNYDWEQNLRIVLQEIAAGERLFDWHTPEGYNAHGDCPDRMAELRQIVPPLAAWSEGNASQAGSWIAVLGESTPEKRWLVASLYKHIAAQHEKHGRLPG
jgi:RNA polymerase sigma factor (sigma-70 family)